MEFPWRLVMTLAWEAYRAGSLPLGAVVVNGSGEPVGQGRSTAAAVSQAVECDADLDTLIDALRSPLGLAVR
jgi:hypothetical protein